MKYLGSWFSRLSVSECKENDDLIADYVTLSSLCDH